MSTERLIENIRELAGNYIKIDSTKLSLIIQDIKAKSKVTNINKLITKLKTIAKKQNVYLPNFKKEIIDFDLPTNLEILCVLLLRKSNSLTKIKSKIIESELIEVLEETKTDLSLQKRKTKKISK